MAIYAFTVKHGSNGGGRSAKRHAEYLAREGPYAHRRDSKDIEYLTHGNMPEWAAQNGIAFWDACDTHERANGRLYTELQVALPRELSPSERRELVLEFVEKEIGNRFVYTAAIHNPRALDGGEQPHVHIMFSTRELDGISRGREQFFKRANTSRPEQGGTKKSREWSKDERANDRVAELRHSWEETCNVALSRAGHEIQIDRRTLKEQGIDRVPEPKMGPIVTQMIKQGRETDRGAEVFEIRDYRRREEKVRTLEEEIRQAQVYDLGDARKRKIEELSIRPEGKARAVSGDERKRYLETVDLVMDKRKLSSGEVEYCWKRSGRVAFVDHGDKITYKTANRVAIKAGLQAARAKGWGEVHAEGSIEFRRESWIEASLLEIKLSGFKATERDHALLAERRREEELKKARYQKRTPGAAAREVGTAPGRVEVPPRDAVPQREEQPRMISADELVKHYEGVRKEIRSKGREVEKEMYALGYKGRDGFLPEAFTEEKAREQAFNDIGGKQLTNSRETERQAKKSCDTLHWEYKMFRQRTEGMRRLHPGNIIEGARLRKELSESKGAHEGAAQILRQVIQELQSPENQKLIEERTKILLEAEQVRQKTLRELAQEDSSLTRKSTELMGVEKKLRRLGQEKVSVKRDALGMFRLTNPGGVEARSLKLHDDDLEHEISRSRGRGRGR